MAYVNLNLTYVNLFPLYFENVSTYLKIYFGSYQALCNTFAPICSKSDPTFHAYMLFSTFRYFLNSHSIQGVPITVFA